MGFRFKEGSLDGVIIIEPDLFPDARGVFFEVYKNSIFKDRVTEAQFVQDNFSFSKKNVLRGLHFQMGPMQQGKLVMAMHGKIWDVVVDIRRGSPGFGKWESYELSAENRKMLYIPPGFAHGFLALTDDVSLFYKCTQEYSPAHDAGIRWNDPELNIPWPAADPIVSEKDKNLPMLKEVMKLMREQQ